jgi:hypothetical protein
MVAVPPTGVQSDADAGTHGHMGEDEVMSNLQPTQGRSALRVPTPPRGDLIARYPTYLEAQRAVEHLSDHQFPVQHVTIVGSGLRMVERVTGRLSYPRVAVAGAWLGASFGSLVGLMFLLFGSSSGSAGGQFGTAVVLGTVFGILQGVLSYALTRGRRDFTSSSQIVASEYEVLCTSEHASAARNLLHELSWGTTTPSPAATPPPSAPPGQSWGSPSAQPSTGASGEAEAPPMDVSGPTYGVRPGPGGRPGRAGRTQRTGPAPRTGRALRTGPALRTGGLRPVRASGCV